MSIRSEGPLSESYLDAFMVPSATFVMVFVCFPTFKLQEQQWTSNMYQMFSSEWFLDVPCLGYSILYMLKPSPSLQVITWGDPAYGGDITSVEALQRSQRSQVRKIQATDAAFAALTADATVVAWGDPKFGGDASGLDEKTSLGILFTIIVANSTARIVASSWCCWIQLQ